MKKREYETLAGEALVDPKNLSLPDKLFWVSRAELRGESWVSGEDFVRLALDREYFATTIVSLTRCGPGLTFEKRYWICGVWQPTWCSWLDIELLVLAKGNFRPWRRWMWLWSSPCWPTFRRVYFDNTFHPLRFPCSSPQRTSLSIEPYSHPHVENTTHYCNPTR